MISLIRFLRPILACGLSAALFFVGMTVHAAPAAATDEGGGALLTAVWLDNKTGATPLFCGQGNAVPDPIRPGNGQRSRPFSVKTPRRPLVFWVKAAQEAGRSPGGAASTVAGNAVAAGFVSVGEVAWPSTTSRRILVLLAGAPSGGPGGIQVRGIAVEDDFTGFPVNSVRVLNLTPGQVMGRLGKDVKAFGAGLSASVAYPVQSEAGVNRVALFPFALATQLAGGRNDVFYSSEIEAYANSRTLIVLAPGTGENGVPLVKTLVEVVAPPPVAKAGNPK